MKAAKGNRRQISAHEWRDFLSPFGEMTCGKRDNGMNFFRSIGNATTHGENTVEGFINQRPFLVGTCFIACSCFVVPGNVIRVLICVDLEVLIRPLTICASY